jgi:hypothetical protein
MNSVVHLIHGFCSGGQRLPLPLAWTCRRDPSSLASATPHRLYRPSGAHRPPPSAVSVVPFETSELRLPF